MSHSVTQQCDVKNSLLTAKTEEITHVTQTVYREEITVSLLINENAIIKIMLTDGRWRDVEKGTFTLDAYEYSEDGTTDSFVTLRGGDCAQAGVPATGFRFTTRIDDTKVIVTGPLTSIVAVATNCGGVK